jgi:hydroxymethylpyrimidine pyrophosphatase-like HAD family hydrolase
MTRPVLITTDLDRTLLFSTRAIAQLGGGLPADPVETLAGEQAARSAGAELCRAARDCLRALPQHARLCVATSRSIRRLARLRLPFPVPYAIAANGGVILVDGVPEPRWEARTKRLLAAAAPAEIVRGVLAGSVSSGGSLGLVGSGGSLGSLGSLGSGRGASGSAADHGPRWLVRTGDADDMCCMTIVDVALFGAEEQAAIAHRCRELGWEASLVGRKLYAFPAGFGKEQAAAHVAERVAALAGAAPSRLAAGDTEHDRHMLADADLAWVPAGSELAAAVAGQNFVITRQPGHAAAAQITGAWLEYCSDRA